MEDNNLQLAEQLILRAKNGEYSEFEFICSLEEYFAVRTIRNAVRKVVKSFITSKNKLYKAYIKSIRDGVSNLDVILSISELDQVIKFYENEIWIVSDMIDEYRAYVHSGHIWDTIVGNYRKEKDLVDFRKVEQFSGE